MQSLGSYNRLANQVLKNTVTSALEHLAVYAPSHPLSGGGSATPGRHQPWQAESRDGVPSYTRRGPATLPEEQTYRTTWPQLAADADERPYRKQERHCSKIMVSRGKET